MNRMGARARSDLNPWMIHLPCGHDVAVPCGSAVPAQMACVVRHQNECFEPLDDTAPSWRAPPLDRLNLVEDP